MNRITFVLVGCIALVAVSSSRAELVSEDKMKECMGNLEKQIDGAEVPAQLKQMVEELWENYGAKKPALSSVISSEKYKSLLAEYLHKLSEEERAAFKESAKMFLYDSIDFKYEIDCDDEDFFEIIDMNSEEYTKFVQGNKKVDDYFALAKLGEMVFDAE